MTRQEDCTSQMRDIYEEFDAEMIANSIKLIRAELTKEELRNKYQIDLLEKQKLLDALDSK